MNIDELPEAEAEINTEIVPPLTGFLPEYVKGLGDGRSGFIGIPTGNNELDHVTKGLHGVIVLGGVAGKGKTSLTLQWGFDTCEMHGIPVIVYSLEMPRSAILTKILNRLARVTYYDILLKGRPVLDPSYKGKGSRLSEESEKALQHAFSRLRKVSDKLYIFDKTGAPITIEGVESQINLIKALHGVDSPTLPVAQQKKVLVIIDHLQIFPIGSDYRDLKDRVDTLLSSFKGIQERTGATIILISQKNRSGYYTKGMEGLMGSAGIEYTADMVMLLDSEEEKKSRKRRTEKKKASYQDFEDPEEYFTASENGGLEKIDLCIVKNRYNPRKTIKLLFDGVYSSFLIPTSEGGDDL